MNDRPEPDADGGAAAAMPHVASLHLPRHPVRALVHAWLILDFFADNRRSGQPSSTLTTTIFGQAFLALVFAALLFPDVPPGAFAAANLSLSTLLVGVGHLGDERGRGRALADRALVATSPLSPYAVLAARLLHAGFYLALLTIGMALPPAILTAFLPGQDAAAVPAYLLLACLCAGLFTAALALLLRAAQALLGPARAELASGTVKALLLFGGVVAFALSVRHLDRGVAGLPLPAWLVQLWPPYHAGRAIAGHLGGAAVLATAFAVLGLLVLPWARDREPRTVRPVATPALLARLDRHLARGRRPLHAVVAFSSAMLYRSPGFRGRVLPLFGMPAGMWLLAFLDRDHAAAQRLLAVALQLPAIYLPFLVALLGAGDEPRARWLFDTSPNLDAAVLRRAIAISLTTHVLLPVHVVLFLVSASTLDPLRAIAGSSLALGLAVLVARFGLRSWTEIPFSGTGGEALDFGTLITHAIVLTLLGLGAAALPIWAALAGGLGVLALAYLDLRRR